jgi:hypothetical protein
MEPFTILVQWQVIDPEISESAHDKAPNYRGPFGCTVKKCFSRAYTAVISSYHFDPYSPMRMDSKITLEVEEFLEELEEREGWREYEVIYPKGGGYKKFNPDNDRYIDPYRK